MNRDELKGVNNPVTVSSYHNQSESRALKQETQDEEQVGQVSDVPLDHSVKPDNATTLKRVTRHRYSPRTIDGEITGVAERPQTDNLVHVGSSNQFEKDFFGGHAAPVDEGHDQVLNASLGSVVHTDDTSRLELQGDVFSNVNTPSARVRDSGLRHVEEDGVLSDNSTTLKKVCRRHNYSFVEMQNISGWKPETTPAECCVPQKMFPHSLDKESRPVGVAERPKAHNLVDVGFSNQFGGGTFWGHANVDERYDQGLGVSQGNVVKTSDTSRMEMQEEFVPYINRSVGAIREPGVLQVGASKDDSFKDKSNPYAERLPQTEHTPVSTMACAIKHDVASSLENFTSTEDKKATQTTRMDNYNSFLDKLGLDQNYANRISLAEAIEIRECPVDAKRNYLPWKLIHMLMSLDSRARDHFLSGIEEQGAVDHFMSGIEEQGDGDHSVSGIEEQGAGDHPVSDIEEQGAGDHSVSSIEEQRAGDHSLSSSEEQGAGDHSVSSIKKQGAGDHSMSGIEEQGAGDHSVSSIEEQEAGDHFMSGIEEQGAGDHSLSGIDEQGAGDHSLSGIEEEGAGYHSVSGIEEQGAGDNSLSGIEEQGAGDHSLSGIEEQGAGDRSLSGIDEQGAGDHFLSGIEEQEAGDHPLPGIEEQGSGDHFLSGTEEQGAGETKHETQDEGSDSDLNFDDSDDETDARTDLPLNPMDVLLATFTCCDGILQQVLAQNLFLCKLAIPLLYPVSTEDNLVLSLWALRAIIVQCSQKPSIETPVTDREFPVISFVRLGRPPRSKSKLLNCILTNGAHQTFYSSESHRTTSRRMIADGVLECSWFLPASKDTLKLTDVTLFLNLRGDGSAHSRQVGFANKVSSLIVVMVNLEDITKLFHLQSLQRICNEGRKVVLLLTNKVKLVDKKMAKKEWKDFSAQVGQAMEKVERIVVKTSMNDEVLGKTLTELLPKHMDPSFKVSLVATAAQLCCKQDGIRVDEMTQACSSGYSLAESVIQEMKRHDIVKCKRNLLPLQERTWQRYSDLMKRNHRAGGDEKLQREIQEEIRTLREEQEEICAKPTTFIRSFFHALLSSDSEEVRVYFLQWMKLLLDAKSRLHLPGLRKKHAEMWEMRDKENPLLRPKQLEQQLEQAERNIASASFGLEHIFREFGHMFEVALERRLELGSELQKALELLPEAAAKLLLAGTPLELVDGDAGSVPITWLKAVLSKLEDLVDGKRLFIISVLGVQSSGKSTLLNTMFGLKFSVSAGRCTRGAFMQVIKVARSDLPVDYLAVIDTEGLRAQELASMKHIHDNELATLAIGLADITLINNKGENTAEMKDVLQIVVHAFMRMKIVNVNLNIDRACILIHQNVSAPDAGEKMRQACQKLQDDLNSMTREAAQSENIQNVKCFTEIIRFDIKKDVLYFPDVWHGNPPMAPVNLRYSENAMDVKQRLFETIKQQQSTSTVSKFAAHIEDLWEGVLTDDFVFSFRNGLEVKAYHAMEEIYCSLRWELEKSVTSWIETTADITLKKCETVAALETACSRLLEDLHAKITTGTSDIEQSLIEFFNRSELKEELAQWREKKLTALKYDSAEYYRECKSHITTVSDAQDIYFRGRTKTEELEKELMERALELDCKLRDTGRSEYSGSDLECEFSRMWEPEIKKLTRGHHRNDIKVRDVMHTTLMDLFQSDRRLISKELERQDLSQPLDLGSLAGSITQADLDERYFHLKKKLWLFWGSSVKLAQNKTLEATSEILANIDKYLQTLSCGSSVTKFQKGHARKAISMLKQHFDKFTPKGFSVLPTYPVKLAVHVSRYCVKVFTKMQDDYEAKHGTTGKLKAFREKAWKVFNHTIKQSAEEAIAADLFIHELEGIVETSVMKAISRSIVNEVISQVSVTKRRLIQKILTQLAHEQDFNKFLLYIAEPRTFALEWIIEYINKTLFSTKPGQTTSRLGEFVAHHTSSIIGCVIGSIETANIEVSQVSENTVMVWIRSFCQIDELPVKPADFKEFSGRNIADFKRFTGLVLQEIKVMQDARIRNLSVQKKVGMMRWEDIAPHQKILDKLWGCTALCPFCKETCCDSAADHFAQTGQPHACLEHRPKGVNGYRNVDSHDQLVTDTCGYSQHLNMSFKNSDTKHGFHPFRDYKAFYPEWSIPPDATNNASKYWAWFMTKYKSQLARRHDAKLPTIPPGWLSIRKVDALESLE